MKKKLIILLLIVALLPVRVFAGGLDSYKENDKQAVIYMFRGQGCGYCRAFLTFLASIADEYGEYFKLVSFEVWYDSTNNELFQKVANYNKENLDELGVPYIMIGDKIFRGYATNGSMDEDIKTAITNQYKNPSYDILKTMKVNASDYTSMGFLDVLEQEGLPEEDEPEETKSSGGSSLATIFWNAAFVIAGAVAIIVVNNKNTQRVLDAMNKKETKEVKETKKKK